MNDVFLNYFQPKNHKSKIPHHLTRSTMMICSAQDSMAILTVWTRDGHLIGAHHLLGRSIAFNKNKRSR